MTKKSTTAAMASRDTLLRWLLAGVVLATLLVFLNGIDGAFHFDDKEHILENAKIRHLSAWRDWALYNPYRAVLNFTFALNYALFGYKTPGWHVVNIALQMTNAALVFFLVRRIFAKLGGEAAALIAFCAALWFGVHPIHTESVTYIITRSELLAGFFSMAAILTWLRARDAGEPRGGQFKYILLSFVFFCLGLLTKESVITLPLIFLAWEWLMPTEGGRDVHRWRRLLPYFLPFALWFVLRQRHLGTLEVPNRAGNVPEPWPYLLTEMRVIWTYVRLLVVPVNQNIDPDIAVTQSLTGPDAGGVIVGALGHLTLVGFALLKRKKFPQISLGILWFYLWLAPSSSIIALKDVMAEHRVYLATAGFFWIAAYGLERSLRQRKLVIAAAVGIAVVFGAMTMLRNRVYKDGVALWSDTIAKSPLKSRPRYNLGNALFNAGRYAEAVVQYDKAIEYRKDFVSPFFNRGNAYNKLNKPQLAAESFKQAVDLKPDFWEGWYNYGVTLSSLERWDEAAAVFEKAAALKPDYGEIPNALGIVYYRQKRYADAEPQFKRAMAINPRSFDPYYNLGLTYAAQQRNAEAKLMFEKSLAINGNHLFALIGLAETRLRLNDDPGPTQALLTRALALQPQLAGQSNIIDMQARLRKQIAKR